MANIQIPNLPATASVSATTLFEAVQAGTSVQVTAAQIGTYIQTDFFGSTLPVNRGGTGATSLTGYVKGNGTSPMTAVSLVPLSDVSGAGTAAARNLAVGTVAPASPSIGDLWVDTN